MSGAPGLWSGFTFCLLIPHIYCVEVLHMNQTLSKPFG
jgi:hypothetical protein